MNTERSSIHLELDNKFIVPELSGPVDYIIKNNKMTNRSLAIGYVESPFIGKIQTLIKNKDFSENSGLGLSPFTTYRLSNIEYLKDSIINLCNNCLDDNLTDIILAFQITVENYHQNINWPQKCLAN